MILFLLMELLTKSISYNKLSHGSSSFSSSSSSTSPSKKHHTPLRKISSSSYTAYICDDEVDVAEDIPFLSQPHNPVLNNNNNNNNEDIVVSSYPSMMTPTSPGEVIVKIDSSDVKDKDNSNNVNILNSTPSTKEFSFRKPDNMENDDDSLRQDPTSKISGSREISFDVDGVELRQQQQQQQQEQKPQEEQQKQLSIRRQMLQGLPPLPPDVLSRQSLSRNPSDVYSPDSRNGQQHMNNNNASNSSSNNSCNTGNAIGDGVREVRVSFQESFNSDQVRRLSSIYSTVEADDSPSSSSSSNEDHEEEGSRSGLHARRASTIKSNSNNSNNDKIGSGEVLRCTSNISSRRHANCVSISKTKSRLMDPPSTPLDQRSGVLRSGPLNINSGLLGKSTNLEEEEEDPFMGDDLPEEFKEGQVSVLLILEWLSLISLVGALICSLVIPAWKKKSLWHMRLWKWDVLVLVIICGRLVSGWGIQILVFFIERNFLLRKRVLYFVYGLKKAVRNVIWLGLVLLTWSLMFDDRVEVQKNSRPLQVVAKLLMIGEIGAVMWLIKTLLVKVCASSFHVNAFFDRIQDSLFNQFVIETLSGPPLFEVQQTQEEESRALAELQVLQNAGIDVPSDLRASVLLGRNKSVQSHQSGKIIGAAGYKSPVGVSNPLSGPISKKNDEGITIDHLHRMNQNNVSAWNMKRLMKIVRHGFLTTLDERIGDATTQDDEPNTQIRSEVEAKAAAKKMFRNVARPRSKYIYLNDLLRFMREDEALKTMSLFEGAAETERISKSSLKNWVINAFRERRALALTLSDTKTAVNKLHKMVNVIVLIIITIMGITFLEIIPSKSLLFLSSQIVVVAFVFGNTCKNVFESIIFLFVIHPFDVGDRCEIDGIQMVVEEMNILTTVFLRYDNLKIVFPNYVLLTKPINNFYRSPDMGEAVEFLVHIATPAEKIAIIRQRITSYIDNKKEHWYPNPVVVLKDAETLDKLRIAVWFQHRMNHQDMGERWIRRAVFVEECVKIFRELDIEYRVYPVNVNITSMPALNCANLNRTGPTSEVVHP